MFKIQEFKCPFSDKCEVTVVTRRFCQKCRLKKCFDVGEYLGTNKYVEEILGYTCRLIPKIAGMKKEWILSDEEKQQKRQKIEENRAKKRADRRRSSAATAASNDDSPGGSPTPPSSSGIPSPATPTTMAVAVAQQSPFVAAEVAAAGTVVGERPQARVLPSSRVAAAAAVASAEIQPSRPKVMRLVGQAPEAVDGSGEPPTGRQFALIKQELGESEPQHPQPPTVESLMLQPLVNAAAAMMATAPIMESQGQQQQQQQVSANFLPTTPLVPPAPPPTSSAAASLVTGQPQASTSTSTSSSAGMIIPDFSHTSVSHTFR